MAYPKTDSNVNFVEIEKQIQKFWIDNGIFQKSMRIKEDAPDFVFNDGPMTANGMPHYGHVSVSAMKDCVCRFKSMQGYRVERSIGWDCHGLPVEIEVMKDLGLKNKDDIIEYGIEKYNAECKKAVMKYRQVLVDTMNRLGRWCDFDNEYKTMDPKFMESTIWALSELYKKGLMYKGYQVQAYSYGAETPLSNSEAKMEYKDKVDPAITVMFKLKDGIDGRDAYALVWTTTPWTLVVNSALVVGENIDYSIMEEGGKYFILATALKESYKKQLENAVEVKVIKGSELIGKEYEPMFDYFEYLQFENGFKIYSGDFVSVEDGTGIVHMAPYGEDDFEILKVHKIPVVTPVDGQGKFDATVSDYEGMLVFDASDKIIQDLKEKGVLVKKENYTHSYPYCWRTKTPLIYMPLESWFVKVEVIKNRLIELNQTINWVPEHLKNGRFGKWLENAKDWGISRNRFWGTPLPVWQSDNPDYPRTDVFGSVAEIEAASGMKVKDLHKPFIDEIVYKNPDDPTGKSVMRRVPDLVDVWFDSGAMTFAQYHYPFENRDLCESRIPADYIGEGLDQTRGWFYTLMVLSVALFDKVAFKNCVTNGLVLSAEKKKLSKSEKNYVSPDILFDTLGAEAFRWYMYNSPLFKAESIAFDEKLAVKAMRDALIPLWNAYHFFTLYANADQVQAKEIFESSNVLDKYILAKLKDLVNGVKGDIEEYAVDRACVKIISFLDILNNWYIRRSRDRFWGTGIEKDVAQEAFDTLYTVLINLAKIMAPLIPHITEYIYKNLTGEESVHLIEWPNADKIKNEDKLITDMDKVQDICSVGKFIREEKQLRNRLPLASVTVVGAELKEFSDIIADELNVKKVVYEDNLSLYADKFLYLITPKIGERLGGALKEIIPASKKGEYEIKGDKLFIAGYELNKDEFEERLVVKDGVAGKALPDNSAVVLLDTVITLELKKEGMVRDFVRAVAEERKEQGLDVTDRINLYYYSDNQEVLDAMTKFNSYVK
ncbi:MAG: isoleucine--tRNA ligase, partial [Rickettsiales bacterium]|nr:isoleucine--tRNA ligase [Rickettsiales bacterium]